MELITTLASEDKRYLGLLTNFIKTVANHHKISEQGIEALVNIDGNAFDDDGKEKLIRQFAPTNYKILRESNFGKMSQELKRAETALTCLLEFTPTGKYDNQYQELLYKLTWHPESFNNVDVRCFRQEFLNMHMAFTFKHEYPKTINMLDQNRAQSLPNMYFAALQLLNGFPPAHEDRATENMFNLLFLEGKTPEYFKKIIAESKESEDEEDGKKSGLEFLVRLESEYIKAMMFYGSIQPSAMTTIEFFKELHSKFLENQYEMRITAERGFSHPDGRYGIDSILSQDPIEFIGYLAAENISRFFHTFGATKYEDIIELFIKTVPEYPKLLTLNHTHYNKDQQYTRLASFIINSTDAIRESGRQDSLLKSVQNSIIDNFTLYDPIINIDEDSSGYLFEALKEVSYDVYERRSSLRALSEAGLFLSNIFRERSIPIIRSIFNETDSHIIDVVRNLPEAFKDKSFNNQFSEYASGVQNSYDLVLFFANFGQDLDFLRQSISSKEVSMKQADESISIIRNSGMAPTASLINRLSMHEGSKEELIRAWEGLLSCRFNSAFDSKDELHKNLGYTQFSNLLEAAHIKNKMSESFKFKWSFDSYLKLLKQKDKITEESLYRINDFEIECAACESSILFDFLVKQSGGKPPLVVPNLNSGYIPVIPIYEDIIDKGMRVHLDAKVGSSDTHDNPTFFDSSIFSSIEETLLEEQPDIIVIDATQHMINRDEADESARYPDAYQGYLNYAIALNEISGTPLTHFCRSEEDLQNLKNKHEFREFVEKYREKYSHNKPYAFEFWNTAELPLIIRKDRKKIAAPSLYQPGKSSGPTIIFCNVGLTHDQIPEHIKSKYLGWTHTPAYFDDSNIIINLELKVCEEGIVIHNQIETLLKKAYSQYNGRKVRLESNFGNGTAK
jgi:hypothetical protein